MSVTMTMSMGEHVTRTPQGHRTQGDCYRRPAVSGHAGGPPPGRRSIISPGSDRRVIFPSLHCASPPSHAQPKPGHQDRAGTPRSVIGGKERDDRREFSPTTVDTSAPNAASKNPFLRANSLDGIQTPLPGASPAPTEGSKTNATFTPLRQGSNAARKSHLFGDVVRHRTYYPAASVPTPVSNKKAPASSHATPHASILRRRAPLSPVAPPQQSAGSSTCSSEAGSAAPLPQAALAAPAPAFPPALPALASPASLKSLQGAPREGDGIGQSEAGLEHLSGAIKILPRKHGSVRRNQSTTAVAHSGAPRAPAPAPAHEGGVARHASHECLPSNKRISFDPHIIVYEFTVTPYERKGGDKWFSEEQLAQFRRDAVHRIRLRSTKVIPTGTGRALTLGAGGAARAMAAPGGKPQGSVFFNHPALGCDDELDESRTSRKSADRGGRHKYASASVAHIRNILVVDSHDIFLKLFKKSLKHMVPHALVATARTSEEAMSRICAARRAFPLRDGGCTHGFDIIIVEERLRSAPAPPRPAGVPRPPPPRDLPATQAAGDDSVQHRWDPTSGAALLRHMAAGGEAGREGAGGALRHSLLVGVSARPALDRDKLIKSGADCVWGKPPPEMNATLRNELLELLMKKRKM